MVDAAEGALGIEWIEGRSIRYLLPGGTEEDEDEFVNEHSLHEIVDPLKEYGITVDALMILIGNELAKMHVADVIHGDLTTSNMMLRHPNSYTPRDAGIPTQLVLIDFGLSYTSNLVEDKAVDLYVLERAFSSTHPDSEPLFASILAAYAKGTGKAWAAIEKRLEDVRLRGRKRSMIG
ncbi:hypothetical protein BDZ94DRAFT_1250756 [Collybia nuda]|uniref:non-specific serine/threonine protein kinase n=1 Tax=Collybia nuda TaxID=64659 RepID=A0A9P6CHT1_9AGAR|nr:hypothetical protein BDZ94DRAFT_1250756 [Collybia nuda]